MTFEAEFLSLMPSTVTVYPLASRNADGHTTFGTTGVTYRARVAYVPHTVHLADGRIQASEGIAWLASTTPLSIQSKYVLPDGSVPIVYAVENIPDQDGQHHSKVFFGSQRATIR